MKPTLNDAAILRHNQLTLRRGAQNVGHRAVIGGQRDMNARFFKLGITTSR